MTIAVAISVVLALLLNVLCVRGYREDQKARRDDVRRKLICMRVGCGHTFADHQPECMHCFCQGTSYKWVSDDLPT